MRGAGTAATQIAQLVGVRTDQSRNGRMQGAAGEGTDVFRKVFAPAEWVSRRLSFSRKFLVLALCLGIPMAYATWQYRNAKEYNVRIAVKESHGVSYMEPAVRLFELEVQARSAAVRGTQVPDFDAAVRAVDATVKDFGDEYENAQTWATAQAKLAAAIAARGNPEHILAAWNRATAALYNDVQQVSAGSTLVLDPQLDTYNTMDSTTNRALIVMDGSGQALDLASLIEAGKVADPESQRIQLAILQGNISSAAATIDAEYDGAYGVTEWSGYRHAVDASRRQLDRSVASVARALGHAVRGDGSSANDARLASQVRTAATRLSESGLPALDELLAQRIGTFRSREHTVYTLVALGALIAAYLFTGIVRTVSRAAGNLEQVLDAAAEGDFDVPADARARHELAQALASAAKMQGQLPRDPRGRRPQRGCPHGRVGPAHRDQPDDGRGCGRDGRPSRRCVDRERGGERCTPRPSRPASRRCRRRSARSHTARSRRPPPRPTPCRWRGRRRRRSSGWASPAPRSPT